MRATFRPALEDVAWFAELCGRLELEAAAVEGFRESFAAHWQRIFERG